MNKIEIRINERTKLVVSQNQEPFEKELNIYLDSEAGEIQDLITVSPDYTYDEKGNVKYLEDLISIKMWEHGNEDFDTELIVPINENN